jgi:hypothetical protein
MKGGYLSTNDTKEDFVTTSFGQLVTFPNQKKERAVGFNVYGKYVLRLSSKLQPYTGAG